MRAAGRGLKTLFDCLFMVPVCVVSCALLIAILSGSPDSLALNLPPVC